MTVDRIPVGGGDGRPLRPRLPGDDVRAAYLKHLMARREFLEGVARRAIHCLNLGLEAGGPDGDSTSTDLEKGIVQAAQELRVAIDELLDERLRAGR